MIAVVIFKLEGGAYLYRKGFLKIKAGERESGRAGESGSLTWREYENLGP